MARPKKATATLASIEDCQQAMRRLLLASIEADAVKAERDKAAADAMRPFDKRLKDAEEAVIDLGLQLQQYYMSHLAEMEKGGARSVKLLYGVMGRRTNPPALRLLNRSWTWAAVREAVRAKLGLSFLRFNDPELDKDRIKQEVAEENLSDVGLKLVQEETFYVEPDRTAEVRP